MESSDVKLHAVVCHLVMAVVLVILVVFFALVVVLVGVGAATPIRPAIAADNRARSIW